MGVWSTERKINLDLRAEEDGHPLVSIEIRADEETIEVQRLLLTWIKQNDLSWELIIMHPGDTRVHWNSTWLDYPQATVPEWVEEVLSIKDAIPWEVLADLPDHEPDLEAETGQVRCNCGWQSQSRSLAWAEFTDHVQQDPPRSPFTLQMVALRVEGSPPAVEGVEGALEVAVLSHLDALHLSNERGGQAPWPAELARLTQWYPMDEPPEEEG